MKTPEQYADELAALRAEYGGLLQRQAGERGLWNAVIQERDALRAELAALSAENTRYRGEIARDREERGALRLLAERAYPGLKASGLCSRHKSPDGHYECLLCYPDLRALITGHVQAHEKTIAERDALRAENELLKHDVFAIEAQGDRIAAERDALRAKVAAKQKLIELHCRDWADTDTEIKRICGIYGVRDDDIPGEFKCMETCVEELADKLKNAQKERDALRAEAVSNEAAGRVLFDGLETVRAERDALRAELAKHQ